MGIGTVAPICPTCGQPAKLSAGKFGTKAECCGLWSWNGKPLVSGETHRWRIFAHAAFDPLWKSGRMKRGTAYARLADVMGMTRQDCHISLMTADQAKEVARAVREGRLDQDTREAVLGEPDEILVRVVASNFVAGLVVTNDRCSDAAPILRKQCRGKSSDELRAYFALRGWKASIVKRGPAAPIQRYATAPDTPA